MKNFSIWLEFIVHMHIFLYMSDYYFTLAEEIRNLLGRLQLICCCCFFCFPDKEEVKWISVVVLLFIFIVSGSFCHDNDDTLGMRVRSQVLMNQIRYRKTNWYQPTNQQCQTQGVKSRTRQHATEENKVQAMLTYIHIFCCSRWTTEIWGLY